MKKITLLFLPTFSIVVSAATLQTNDLHSDLTFRGKDISEKHTATPPVNDVIGGAVSFTPSPAGTGCDTEQFSLPFSTDGTTDSGLDSSCDVTNTGLDQFFTWTATTDGLYWDAGSLYPGIVIRDASGNEIDCIQAFDDGAGALQGWNIGDDLVIQIYAPADVGSTDVTFCLEEFTLPPAPNCATNPTPIDGATGVQFNNNGHLTLSWNAPSTGPTPTDYLVYFGTSSGNLTPYALTNITSILIFGNIDLGTTYYWRVVPKNGVRSAIDCPEWSFTMVDPPPPPVNDLIGGAIPIIPSPAGTGCSTPQFTLPFFSDGTTDSGLDGTCNGANTGRDQFFTWTATTDGLLWYDKSPGKPGIIIRDVSGNEIDCANPNVNSHVLRGWNIGDDLIIQIYDVGSIYSDVAFCLEEYTLSPPIVPDYMNDFSPYPGDLWTEAIGDLGMPIGTNSSWRTGIFGNNTSSVNGVSARISITNTQINSYLISPRFNLSASTYYLNFDIALTEWDFTNPAAFVADRYVVLLVTEDDGVNWTELRRWDMNTSISPTGEITPEITLAGYGSEVQFAFYAFSSSEGVIDFFVDNFQVTGNSQFCTSPTDLSASVTSDTETTISWIAGGAETNWNYEWGETGFTQGTGTTGSVSTNSVDLSGLVIGTTYDIYVEADCGGLNTSDFTILSWTNPVPPPANDNCSNATIIGSLPYLRSEDATHATNNGGFIVECDEGMNDGVWYAFNVVESGTIDIGLTNIVGWNPELSIYSGSCGAFVCEATTDAVGDGGNESLTGVPVTGGTTYYMNIGGFSHTADNTEGPYTLEVTTPDTTTLSVDDNLLEGFSLYPTIVKQDLNFNASENVKQLSVYNLLGQEVFRSTPNESNSSLNLSNLKGGVYMVKVQIGTSIGKYKIIKE